MRRTDGPKTLWQIERSLPPVAADTPLTSRRMLIERPPFKQNSQDSLSLSPCVLPLHSINQSPRGNEQTSRAIQQVFLHTHGRHALFFHVPNISIFFLPPCTGLLLRGKRKRIFLKKYKFLKNKKICALGTGMVGSSYCENVGSFSRARPIYRGWTNTSGTRPAVGPAR